MLLLFQVDDDDTPKPAGQRWPRAALSFSTAARSLNRHHDHHHHHDDHHHHHHHHHHPAMPACLSVVDTCLYIPTPTPTPSWRIGQAKGGISIHAARVSLPRFLASFCSYFQSSYIYIQSLGVATPSTSQPCARSLSRRVVRRQSFCTLLIAPGTVPFAVIHSLSALFSCSTPFLGGIAGSVGHHSIFLRNFPSRRAHARRRRFTGR